MSSVRPGFVTMVKFEDHVTNALDHAGSAELLFSHPITANRNNLIKIFVY